MYEKLITMDKEKRNTFQERLIILSDIPPFGSYIGWITIMNIGIALVLLGYAYSWIVAPDVGVINWLNGHMLGSNVVLTWWAFIGATVLVNYASIREELPMRWYFIAIAPLPIHGIAAVVSQIAIVASIAHMTTGLLSLLMVGFFVSTVSRNSKQALEFQDTIIKVKQLELENANLKLKLSEADHAQPSN